MDMAMTINGTNLKASLRSMDKLGERNLELLRESDPAQAARAEHMNEVFGDTEFMAQFFACDEKEDMIKLCEERGISMTMEELDEILGAIADTYNKLVANDGELSDEELEQVAGGLSSFWGGLLGGVIGAIAGAVIGAAVGFLVAGPAGVGEGIFYGVGAGVSCGIAIGSLLCQ